MPASQAGRRGFESRLPLHLFNNLETSEIHALLRLLRFLSGDRLDDCVPAAHPSPESRVSLLNHLIEELLEFSILAVGEGIHRVYDNRLDTAAASATENVINDGSDVG